MTNKILFLLEELKENFTDQLFNDTLKCFREEISISNLYLDIELSKNVLNGQSEKFYNELAFDFVEDLNEFTEMYFLLWEPLLYFFNSKTKNYFLETALELSHNTDATDYINGIIELENESPDIALFHFNRIEDYVASYFIAICYLELENFENSIKQNEKFLKNLNKILENKSEINLENNEGILILKWNIFNDIAFAYNRISEFQNALKNYDKSLDLFSLEENYKINHTFKIDGNLDEFTVFANNYLLSLEQTRNYSKCIEVVIFLIDKYPNDYYYKSKLEKLKTLSESQKETNFIFDQIFKSKKPFNINSFEATKLISKEKILEDMIVEQIKYGFEVFGKKLEIYQDEEIFGRQYRIQEINGILDLLLIDRQENQLYVVELKRNEAGIEVVSQIENYMIALSKQLDRKLKGIICLHKSNNQLTELVKTKNDIELFTYNFEFKNEI